MTLREQYEEKIAAWHEARSRLLSDRLTLSRKQAQMHEADVEEADEQAEYFAGRRAEMAARVRADEERLAALAAETEEVRVVMVTEELDATLASFAASVRDLEAYLTGLHDEVARAAILSEQAMTLADTLPPSAARQRAAADAVAEQSRAIKEQFRQLLATLHAPPAASSGEQP